MTQDNTKLRETLVEILLIDDQVSVNNNLLDELEALIAREVDKASHSGLVRARVACSFNKDCLRCEANRLSLEYLIKPEQLKEGV